MTHNQLKTQGNAGMTSGKTPASADTLEIRDSRTGKTYTIAINEGTIRATDLRQIKVDDNDFGLMTYDPAFMNTASCRSAITFIDGDKGILRYRGYPIEQLAEKATFLEVAWLLRNGELPTQTEYDQWVHDITYHTYVHENIKRFLEGFRYDAHPMAMLAQRRRGAVVVLSGSEEHPRSGAAQHLDHPPAREAADARGVLLSPREGTAVRLSRQRPLVRARISCRWSRG